MTFPLALSQTAASGPISWLAKATLIVRGGLESEAGVRISGAGAGAFVAALDPVALSALRPGEAVGVLLLLVAVEVGAFAVVQLLLARRRSDAPGSRH